MHPSVSLAQYLLNHIHSKSYTYQILYIICILPLSFPHFNSFPAVNELQGGKRHTQKKHITFLTHICPCTPLYAPSCLTFKRHSRCSPLFSSPMWGVYQWGNDPKKKIPINPPLILPLLLPSYWMKCIFVCMCFSPTTLSVCTVYIVYVMCTVLLVCILYCISLKYILVCVCMCSLLYPLSLPTLYPNSLPTSFLLQYIPLLFTSICIPYSKFSFSKSWFMPQNLKKRKKNKRVYLHSLILYFITPLS